MLLRLGLLRTNRPLPGSSTLRNARHVRRSHSSFGKTPGQASAERLLYSIIGVNTAIFAAWKYADSSIPVQLTSKHVDLSRSRVSRELIDHFVLKINDPRRGRWWTAVTHAFSHQNLPHFAFNMIALQSFGDALIAYVPGLRASSLAALYVGAGLAGALGWIVQQNADRSERGSAGALGASGAVSGISAAVALLAPTAKWQFMFVPIGVPAWLMFSGYIAYGALYMNDPNNRIGHSSHLGGAAFGAAFYFVVLRRVRFR